MMRSAIFDDAGEIEGFSSLKVNIIRTARVIGAPVESGQTSFDNKVIDPTKVVVTGVITIDSSGNYNSILKRLNAMFANREYKFYRVCDGASIASNLILHQFPVLRDVDKYDFLNIELTFVEAMLVQKEMRKTANSEDGDIRDLGSTSGSNIQEDMSTYLGNAEVLA